MTTERGNVYLIDDNPVVRSALHALLRASGYAVTDFASAEMFLIDARVKSPAVILTDMRMPTMTGLELLARLNELGQHPSVIVISGESTPQEIVASLKGGAIDFLFKPVSNEELLAAIARGLDLDRQRMASMAQMDAQRAALASLTAREREIATLIRQGFSNKQIAQRLEVRADTIKRHRAQIYDKLGVTDLVELLAFTTPDLGLADRRDTGKLPVHDLLRS